MSVRHNKSFKSKHIRLDNKVSILYSAENTTGKTTIMRAILFALGFAIPNTELIKFNDYEIIVELKLGDELHTAKRIGHLLSIDETEYDLPTDQASAHAFLFKTTNNELLSNLLGTIYFDQEKGWTLLNRGTIIGENRFNIESFFRGLKGDESDDSYRLVASINALGKQIEQCKIMLSVSEYHESINRDIEHNLVYQSFDHKLASEILAKKVKLDSIENEIALIADVIKKNRDFSAYITSKKLFVKHPDGGEPIRVTSETLLNYNDLQDTNTARKAMLTAERNKLKREIAHLEQAQTKEGTLIHLPSIADVLSQQFVEFRGMSSIRAHALLDQLEKERRDQKTILNDRTARDNEWLLEAYQIVEKYAHELQIPSEYRINIMTSNLKEKSGAVLHKMIFSYKLAYVSLLSKKLKYPLPIFFDSPSGREVKSSAIKAMFRIITRDFSQHQIIIASIYNYHGMFVSPNIVSVDKTLFDKQTLFD